MAYQGGGTIGNQNARRAREFRDALRRVFVKKHGSIAEGLEVLATKLYEVAETGEQWAIKEIADRWDGKVPQAHIGGDDDDAPIKVTGVIDLVRPGA